MNIPIKDKDRDRSASIIQEILAVNWMGEPAVRYLPQTSNDIIAKHLAYHAAEVTAELEAELAELKENIELDGLEGDHYRKISEIERGATRQYKDENEELKKDIEQLRGVLGDIRTLIQNA